MLKTIFFYHLIMHITLFLFCLHPIPCHMSYAFPQMCINDYQKEGRTFLDYTIFIRDKMILFNISLYGQNQRKSTYDQSGRSPNQNQS